MTEETPQDRLNRLMNKVGKRERPVMDERAQKAAEKVVEELKKALGGNAEITVKSVQINPEGDVTIDGEADGEGLSSEELHKRAKEIAESIAADFKRETGTGPDGEPVEFEHGIISMSLDLSPLREIHDEKSRNHSEQILREHDVIVKMLAGLHPNSTLPTFVRAMGEIVVRGGMSGAMILAGKKGLGQLGPEEFQAAMVGSVGGTILAALRYGQNHPEALTLADGVDATQITSAIDDFLATLGEDDHKEED